MTSAGLGQTDPSPPVSPADKRRPRDAIARAELPCEGRRRAVIESVEPTVDGGQYPAKRVIGEEVTVKADVFADGHDAVACVLRYRRDGDQQWRESPMSPVVNDRWEGRFQVDTLGRYEFSIVAWIDHFESWRRDLNKKSAAGQDVSVDLEIGAQQLDAAAERASNDDDTARLERLARFLRDAAHDQAERIDAALDESIASLMHRLDPRPFATETAAHFHVIVDPPQARFSTWYELFPRSWPIEPGRHGTFRDLIHHLPYIASMGFDVLYLPPIHPIGRTHRKGPNNRPSTDSSDVGSPWAIGGEEGGHKSIHPALGTLKDFRALVSAASDHGLQIALDIAFQCSPDHPYALDHPEWFRHRPDGSIQYAENPPKKYQDIYPFDFECDAWASLWRELKSIFDYWIEQGVTIFRVDNPHTKSFAFWQWCIGELKRAHPEAIFLSEAFTRPKVMKRLAKLGFTQSYTYFAWKNAKHELEEYFTELTRSSMVEYFRPNAWPNTPDILNEYLQLGGRPAFMARLVLAATLTSNYGIYGPAFELLQATPREPGSEEYLDSEKYQLRRWNLDQPDSLRDFIARINRIRRENPALQSDRSLRFHSIDNDMVIGYSKSTADRSNVIVTVVNLDPHHMQSGFIELPLQDFDLDEEVSYQVHDLLTGNRYMWTGRRNYIELNPHVCPAHILQIQRRAHTEQDFEHFL